MSSEQIKPGYKRTEVGVIPEEWEVKRLGELIQDSKSIRYGIVQPGKFNSGGCFMLRSQDYSKGWAGIDGMHQVTAELELQFKNAKLKTNDLVMTIVGAGIGQVVTVPDWLNGAILSRSTARIAIDEAKAKFSFVKNLLESSVGTRQIIDCQKEGAQPVVSCLDLAKFLIPIPAIKEQGVIATVLSDVDSLLTRLDQLISKKRDLKQAAMQQLLTGQTRLPGFSGEWEVKRLEDVADIDPENLGANTPQEYKFKYISLEDVDFGMLRSWSEQIFSTAPSRARRLLKSGDVLVSTVRPNLKSHLHFNRNSKNWVCSTGFSIVRCRHGLADSAYVFQQFFAGEISRQIEMLLTGSNYPAINSRDVRTLKMPTPAYEEQIAISTILSDIDAEIARLEARRDKTHALKQGVMHELLTGKIRLI